MALGDQVSKTGISVPVEKARLAFAPVVSGNCLYVTNPSDYVTLPTTWLWGTRWSCFFKAEIFSTPNSAARLFSNDSETIMLTVGGIQVTQGGGSATSGNVLIWNEWHDYGIVYTGEHLLFYRDGYPVDAKAFTTNPSTNAWAWTLFNRPDHLRQCDMNVAYFQFYNRAFSAEEVLAHLKSNPNDTQNLEVYYKCNEGTGTTLADSSPNERHATITNCAWTTFSLPYSTVTYMGASSIASLRTAATNRFWIRPGKSILLGSGKNISSSLIVPQPTGFNVGFWMRKTNIGGAGVLMGNYSGTDNGWKIYTPSTGALWNHLYDVGNTVNGSGGDVSPRAGWIYIIVSFAPNDYKVYRNNIQVFSDTTCTMKVPAGNFVCGNSEGFAVAELTYQNRASVWTAQERADLYYRNLKPSGASWYNFLDNVADQSGNGLNFTPTNIAYSSTDAPPMIGSRSSV